MGFRQRFQGIIKKCDLFSQPITLRYGQQPEYETFTGGFCSIVLIVTFVCVFTGTLINTFNRIYINSSVTQFDEIQPSYYSITTQSFMFAVGISNVNVNQGPRWFDITFQARSYNGNVKNKTTVPLQKCEKHQWTKINDRFGTIYDRLALDQWLCPQENFTMVLEGKFTSQFFKFYKIGVQQCNNALIPSRPCIGSAAINSYLDSNEAFNFNFYFVNTILNPGDQQYISQYLEDFNYFPFSPTYGVIANLFVSSYAVSTDNSILPVEDNKQDKGGIVLDSAQFLNYQVRLNQYMKFNIRKSSRSLQIQRSYRKIDDTVSYIGGLFSAILSFLLIINQYNEISFQLDVAKTIYKYNKDEKLESQKFNLFTFFGYMIFSFFETIGIDLQWKRMQIYHHCLEQVKQQMDIRLIFRKIQFSQKVAQSVLEPHQLKLIHLQEYLTLEEAQQIRQDYEFYDKLQRYYLQYENESQKESGKLQVDHVNENSLKSILRLDPQIKFSNKVSNECSNELSVSHCPPRSSKYEDNIDVGFNGDDSRIFNLDRQNSSVSINKSPMLDYPIEIKEKDIEIPKQQIEEDEFKQEMEEMIKQLKECFRQLKKQANEGKLISKKIIENMDQRLIQKLIVGGSYQKYPKSSKRLFNPSMKKSIILHEASKKSIENPPILSPMPTQKSILRGKIFRTRKFQMSIKSIFDEINNEQPVNVSANQRTYQIEQPKPKQTVSPSKSKSQKLQWGDQKQDKPNDSDSQNN